MMKTSLRSTTWLVLSSSILWLMLPYTVTCCGGVWKTNVKSHLVMPSGTARFTQCKYHGNSMGKTPDDIRPDTEMLSLPYNELDSDTLNVSLIRNQVDHLFALDISYNKFTQIPDVSLFNSSLSYLSLIHNLLISVDFDYFSIFPNLRTLHLADNDITSFTLSQPISVVFLYLQGNNLKAVDINDFSILGNLYELHLSSNPFLNFTLPQNSEDLQGLKVLAINWLPQPILKHVIPRFQNLSTLTKLLIGYNEMVSLDLSNYTTLPMLTHLWLYGNPFKTFQPLPENITLSELTYLTLSSCQFEGQFNLTSFASHALPALIHLSLYANKITSLFLEPGHSLRNLQQLNLEKNNIIHLDLEFYIRSAPALNNLRLDHNSITQLNFPKNGSFHPTLQYLLVRNNPLVSMTNYCIPYFTGGDKIFRIYLDATDLRCDACLLWFVSCQYKVYSEDAVCMSPAGAKGKAPIQAAKIMVDFPCQRGTDMSNFFVKKTADSNVQPVLTIHTMRGQQECAYRTKMSEAMSFTYNENTHECDIFNNDAGHFTLS